MLNLTSKRLLTLTAMLSLIGCSTIDLSQPERKASNPNSVSPKQATTVPTVVEKRETLTATGYAVISVQQNKNPAQQRLMAIRASKLDAYRTLTEQVYGQQLDANSTVADMMGREDIAKPSLEVIYDEV